MSINSKFDPTFAVTILSDTDGLAISPDVSLLLKMLFFLLICPPTAFSWISIHSFKIQLQENPPWNFLSNHTKLFVDFSRKSVHISPQSFLTHISILGLYVCLPLWDFVLSGSKPKTCLSLWPWGLKKVTKLSITMCIKEIHKWIHESYTKINEAQCSTKMYWLKKEIWSHVFLYLIF